MIPKQIDRYLIQSEIGRGGMATVYLALQKGRTTNRVRADYIGNKLTLYVNDLKLVRSATMNFRTAM